MTTPARIFIVAMAILFAACGRPSLKEITRGSSPDRQFDAVLVEVQLGELGATVSTPYQVYIVPTGGKTFDYPTMKGSQFEGLRLIWKDPRFLEIEYSKGQIYSFQNFKDPRKGNLPSTVEIRLVPTTDRALPK
jgi:hypothetical protein